MLVRFNIEILDQIDDIIQRYVGKGGEKELRAMIRQELTAVSHHKQA